MSTTDENCGKREIQKSAFEIEICHQIPSSRPFIPFCILDFVKSACFWCCYWFSIACFFSIPFSVHPHASFDIVYIQREKNAINVFATIAIRFQFRFVKMHFRFHRFCLPLLCAKCVWCHCHFSPFAYSLRVRLVSLFFCLFHLFISLCVFFFSRRFRCNVTVIVCLLCSNKTKRNKNICAEIYMRMWHSFALQWKCFLFPLWLRHFFSPIADECSGKHETLLFIQCPLYRILCRIEEKTVKIK